MKTKTIIIKCANPSDFPRLLLIEKDAFNRENKDQALCHCYHAIDYILETSTHDHVLNVSISNKLYIHYVTLKAEYYSEDDED